MRSRAGLPYKLLCPGVLPEIISEEEKKSPVNNRECRQIISSTDWGKQMMNKLPKDTKP